MFFGYSTVAVAMMVVLSCLDGAEKFFRLLAFLSEVRQEVLVGFLEAIDIVETFVGYLDTDLFVGVDVHSWRGH